MRVLFVNQYFPPDASATAHLLGELTEDLAREHHEVRVVAGRPSYNPKAGPALPAQVDVRRALSTSFDRATMIGRSLNYASFLLGSLYQTFRGPAPDVVVAMTDPPIIGAVAALAARCWRRPFVQVYQDLYPDIAVALGHLRSRRAIRTWRRLNHFVRGEAARIVVVGRDMRARLEADGVPTERIEWLPNWGNTEPLSPAVVKETRAALGWDGRFVVAHGGNLGQAQNLATLLDAAAALRHRPDFLFAFVGDGAARRGLAQQAGARELDNVRFLPQVAKASAAEILGAADLHVVSLAPGLAGMAVPSKVYGILGLGLPFVGAVEAGSEIDLLIRDTRAGVRVDPGDGSALARAAEDFASNRLDGVAMGRAGRKVFRSDYDRTHGTERYRRLIEAVVSSY